MEEKLPLKYLGNMVRTIRKKSKMNQVDFYQFLFPEKEFEEENIKKKMNAIENGKMKRVDYELLFRLHDKFDLSLDYLCGYETEYPNYEVKAASEYTGLSPEAIGQLHFWKNKWDEDIPDDTSRLQVQMEKREAKWILQIASKLLEKKSEADEASGIADLSILFDIYMLTLDMPQTIRGIPEETVRKDISFIDKAPCYVQIAAETLSFTDQMGMYHQINIEDISKQIWKQRLLTDLDDFIEHVRETSTHSQD